MLWRLAWRNVWRNRRRSAMTVLAITIGVGALTFLWGFVDGMNREMVENTTRYFAGDAQIHRRGYHSDPTLDLAIDDVDPVIGIVQADVAVAAASVRMEGRALASSGSKSRGVMVVGVDPSGERTVTRLLETVVAGSSLDATTSDGALIGVKLAETLGVQPGDEVVLVGQAYDGSVAASRIHVRGVFETRIDESDGFVVVMPLILVREFFVAPGTATAIVLRLLDRQTLEPTGASLSDAIGDRFEVVGWPTLLPMVQASVRYHEVLGFVVLAIFFAVVAAGVANPVLMAVLERTREFGVMLAIGTSESRLFRVVLFEAALLGVFGLLLGNMLGLSVTAWFQQHGIDFSAFEAGLRTMPGLSNMVYPAVRLDRSVMISVVVFATACLVSFYPAAKAARLEPVAAIRGIAGRRWAGGSACQRLAPRFRLPVFVRVAVRNIGRNPRRTAITTGGTAFAIAAFVFLFAYYDGFGEQIVDTATRYLTGHVQVERPGFRRDLAPELALDNPEPVLAALRSLPDVAAAAPRVQAQALASSPAGSESILLLGISPSAEREVTFIDRAIIEGTMVAPDDAQQTVIGRELAAKLDVRVGEKIVIMAQDANGELGSAAYRVSGIFATESASFDRTMAFINLPAAQALLGLGSRISTINVRLTDRARMQESMRNLRRDIGDHDVALVSWAELLPQVDEMVGVIGVMRAIVLAIVFTVTALAVMNTVFMAVAERTREFGMLMAIGTAPGAIVRLVLYETALLMTLASAIGYGAGGLLVRYFARRGVDLSRFFEGYSAIPGLTGVSYPVLSADSLILPGMVLFMVTLLASVYPAARAAAMDPATAVRHA